MLYSLVYSNLIAVMIGKFKYNSCIDWPIQI